MGKIIGEGFTSPYGGPHAEVNAIRSVPDRGLLKEATLYVTLEPCSHFGKTPPCADLIIEHQIPRVVIGCLDPNERVAGKGVQRLRESGCSVQVGLLEGECREHHKRFLLFQEQKRPYVILKWAETLDGFIAPERKKPNIDPKPFWISNPYSRQLVHQWRSEEQAILVGTNTVLEDNPKLNVRNWTGKDPLRVILDKGLKINKAFHVLDGSIETLVLTQVADPTPYLKGIGYETLDFSGNLATQVCQVLHEHRVSSVLVEGGARTLQTFIDENFWDEARVFTGNAYFNAGIAAPELPGSPISSKTIGSDTLKIYRNA